MSYLVFRRDYHEYHLDSPPLFKRKITVRSARHYCYEKHLRYYYFYYIDFYCNLINLQNIILMFQTEQRNDAIALYLLVARSSYRLFLQFYNQFAMMIMNAY